MSGSGLVLIASKHDDDLIVLDGDGVGADADFRAGEGTARGDVELPAMPRAGEDFAVAHPLMLPARFGVAAHRAIHRALAERPERVRANIRQRVERAIDIEDADLDIANSDNPMRVLRKLRHRPDNMRSHASLRS